MILRDYSYYRQIFMGQRLPLAFVDMDLFDANAKALTQRASGLPMRVATKSIRCVALIKYLLDQGSAFRGVMAYSAAEAAFLVEHGIDDILIGYPTVEESEIVRCINLIKSGKTICFMVDHHDQVELLQRLGLAHDTTVPVCLDIDLSTELPGLHFGVYRSPITSAADAEPLINKLIQLTRVKLVGVMGYEAQLAGVADAVPGAWLKNRFIRLLKRWARRDCFPRRQGLVAHLRNRNIVLKFVNGGGTGSIEDTRLDESVTELTVGSGLYGPTLFDHYSNFRHAPAAGFALPVVRCARPGIYACSGGGYIASGPIGRDKQPSPYLPDGIQLINLLGAGEVQTSIRSDRPLQLGDPVIFRHAKAGELLERFNDVHLIRGGRLESVAPTYRGQRQCYF